MRLRTLLASLSCLGLFGVTSFAAEEEQASEPRRLEITPDIIIQHLQQDIFLKPGAGLRKIHLGISFKEVLKLWGKPNEVKNRGLGVLGGNSRLWRYERKGDANVVLAGNQVVQSIEINGTRGALYQSTEGARFGMASRRVISIYGKPQRVDGNKISYDRRGIAFIFDKTGLRAMRVFPRGKPF